MKKILLLSIASFTMLMADFTLIGEQLTPVNAYEQTPTTETSNPYLEPVNIPVYDSSDPSHLLITEANGKWTSSNLNNPSYKHFYVAPGNYSGSIITLTANGTPNDRRSISLYNGNDIHPAAMTDVQQADVKLKFDNASYWDIDRMSFLSYQNQTDVDWLYNGSSYNVLNRIHLKNYYYGIRILHNSNYNTIQNSYLNHMTHAGRMSDNIGIAITTSKQNEDTTILGTKIINNDIRNATDGIQAVKGNEDYLRINFSGTVIDNNRIWVDGDVYTNGDYSTNGYNANGKYMIAEDAMDFKSGSHDINNPFIITNNKMWGYRQQDPVQGKGRGSCIVIHFGCDYMKVENNIMFDTVHIGAFNSVRAASPYSSNHSTFKNNIMYDIGNVNPKGDTLYMSTAYWTNDIQFENNTYINFNNGYYHRFENTSGNMTFNNNLMIDNAAGVSGNDGATVTGNYYYNTSKRFSKTGTEFIETDPHMSDYTFEYEVFTASPKSKTLTGVISTPNSPHYGVAGSNIE